MALRSVLDIDVNSASFDKFRDNFKLYQEALSKQPAEWEDVKKGVDGTAKSFQALVTASIARQAHARTIAAAEGEASRHLDRQARTWHDIARSTTSVAGNIVSMTRSLLRWSALSGLFTGVLGIGGLFGLDRLAASAAGQRRAASGLGVTPGQQRSFELNYGRIIPADNVLGAVNEALTDPSKRAALYRAGLTEQDLRGKNAAEVGALLTERLKTLSDKTPTGYLGTTVRNYGFNELGFTEQDARRLRDRPLSELRGYRRDFEQNSRDLDLRPQVQKAWDDLNTQLSRAGGKIEATFITGLTPLAKPLEQLSAAVEKSLRDLLAAPELKDWIVGLGQGIKWFGDEIRTPEFRQGMVDLVSDIGKLAKAIREALSWLFRDGKPHSDVSIGGDQPKESSEQELDAQARKWWEWLKRHAPDTTSGGAVIAPMGYTGQPYQNMVHDAIYRPSGGGGAPAGRGGGTGDQFDWIETADNLPHGLLDSVWNAESGRGRNMGPSSAGALGHFQFMPKTWSAYGKGSPFDLNASSQAAGKYLSKLLAEFHGDTAKAVAAYNWGEGNVEKDVARWGADWRSHLPRETQGYLNKVLPGVGVNPMRGGQQWAVNIYNNTGGSAIVTAAQL